MGIDQTKTFNSDGGDDGDDDSHDGDGGDGNGRHLLNACRHCYSALHILATFNPCNNPMRSILLLYPIFKREIEELRG